MTGGDPEALPPALAHAEIHFVLRVNELGGAELSMLKLAEGLKRKGLRVSMLVYGARLDLVSERNTPVEVIPIKAMRTLAAFMPVVRTLRRRRPVFIISALTHTNLMVLAAAVLSGIRARVIATEHGPPDLATSFHESLSHFLFRRLAGVAYMFAAALVAVSVDLATKIRSSMPARRPVHTIFNPVVTRVPVTPSRPPHPWLRAEEPIPVIMGVGRLAKVKNFALLVRSFAVVAAGRTARLIVLGEGEERHALIELASQLGLSTRVFFAGFVEEVSDWLQHADVFVSASSSEGFGNAIVEALACGCAVVATDCPYGPAEILDQGRYGRLVPVNDPDAMATAIAAALDRPGDRQQAIERAGMFTEALCVDAYIRLLHSLLPVAGP